MTLPPPRRHMGRLSPSVLLALAVIWLQAMLAFSHLHEAMHAIEAGQERGFPAVAGQDAHDEHSGNHWLGLLHLLPCCGQGLALPSRSLPMALDRAQPALPPASPGRLLPGASTPPLRPPIG